MATPLSSRGLINAREASPKEDGGGGEGEHRVRGRSKKTKVPLKNVNRVRSANTAPTLNTFLRNFFRNLACFTDFLNACEKTLVSFGNAWFMS